MMPLRLFAAVACLALFVASPFPAVGSAEKARLVDLLLASRDAVTRLDAAVIDLETLRRVYEGRARTGLWKNGRAEKVLGLLRLAEAEGLAAEDFPVAVLTAALNSNDPEVQAKADLLLTQTVLEYLSQLTSGRLAPKAIDPVAFARTDPDGATSFLDRLLNGHDPVGVLREAVPGNPVYLGLRRALARYRVQAELGGWPRIPDGPVLKEGMADPRVPLLRQRLRATGDMPAIRGDETFDAVVRQGVVHFQRRHGLVADGVLGPATLAALNVPAHERVRQILVNMERWRWMPDDMGPRHVLVNIAGFRLEYFRDGRQVLDLPVVIGVPYRKTPVFSGTITHIVFNPDWTVPTTILHKDILPKARRNPGWLRSNGFRVFDGWEASSREVDPAAIDWGRIKPGTMPYRFVRRPGPENPLGRVKFMFPNRYDVYVHDTPDKDKFMQVRRAFSSGCIRLEDPFALARALLEEGAWDAAAIDAAVASGRTETAFLPRPVPIHLTYSTAWAERDGTVHFREDIYGRDTPLLEALFAGH